MIQDLTFSDGTDAFRAIGSKEVIYLQGETRPMEKEHPNELVAFVAISSQMFYDHHGRYEDQGLAHTEEVRMLFDLMRKVVGID